MENSECTPKAWGNFDLYRGSLAHISTTQGGLLVCKAAGKVMAQWGGNGGGGGNHLIGLRDLGETLVGGLWSEALHFRLVRVVFPGQLSVGALHLRLAGALGNAQDIVVLLPLRHLLGLLGLTEHLSLQEFVTDVSDGYQGV